MTEEYNIWRALRRASFVLAVFSDRLQVLKSTRTERFLVDADEALELLQDAVDQNRFATRGVPSQELIHNASFLLAVTGTRIDILKDRYNPDGVRWIGATYATVEVRLKRAWQQTLVDAVLASEEETG